MWLYDTVVKVRPSDEVRPTVGIGSDGGCSLSIGEHGRNRSLRSVIYLTCIILIDQPLSS